MHVMYVRCVCMGVMCVLNVWYVGVSVTFAYVMLCMCVLRVCMTCMSVLHLGYEWEDV